MRTLISTSFLAASLVVAASASAQEAAVGWATADPLFGNATLETGFTPDPHTVTVTAGGGDEVSVVGAPLGTCVGMITAAQPDYRVNYTAGDTFPLRFYVHSEADTTLVVNAGDGSWHCNDDGGGDAGLNPVVHIANPPSGQYDIWVGVFGDAGTASATLAVTELESQGPGSHN